MAGIEGRVRGILEGVPPHVTVVAAAKTRTPDEIRAALGGGIRAVGENYVQETEIAQSALGRRAAEWHLIGVLQRSVVPILIEVNSGREPQKAGIFPEDVEGFAREIAGLASIEVRGLMTLGPALPEPVALRPFFAETRRRFDALARLGLSNARMTILSMGMSDSYREAIEEGATMVRLGTALFGARREDG